MQLNKPIKPVEFHQIKIVLAALLFAVLLVPLFGCGGADTSLNQAEKEAIFSICGVDAAEFTDISAQVLDKHLKKKFPAVVKIFKYEGIYAFISAPVAFNGPVTLAIVIDSETGESVGLQIVEHQETEHYVRDMESGWFTSRFAGKSVLEYLKPARLTAGSESEIVAITGATISTEGIINGVNAAFGVYQEYILGQIAPDVPYMVRFDAESNQEPEENGSLVIRAEGLILGEISLDEIRELPSVKRTMSIHSSAGVTQHAFRGTLLSNILNLLDPDLTASYEWALTVGVDDYISGISMSEINAENSVYLMYEDNGEPLPRKNGQPGSMRVVVIDDFFGQRFTNYLLEIVLENEEPT